MKYATASAFRHALETRLNVQAQSSAVPIRRLRKLVVFERLLARLAVVAPDRWVLKGAVALLYRAGPTLRTTNDLDLGRQDAVEDAVEDFIAAQACDLLDHFSFVITKDPSSPLDGTVVRFRVAANLAGRIFEQLSVDVGFGDRLSAEPDVLTGPNLLQFADVAPVPVPTLPLAQHIAEKVHAYTQTRSGERENSRVKDLVDLLLIQGMFDFTAGDLRRALQSTFFQRATHALPETLPPPPASWSIPFRVAALDAGLGPEITEGFQRVSEFLNPLLGGSLGDSSHWDHMRSLWLY